MNNDDLTCVNVAGNALVEFIEHIAVAGSSNITVSQGDRGWYVTYKPPFTRDIKEDASKEVKRKDICTSKYKVSNALFEPVDCYEVYNCEKCKFFMSFCNPQERAEANCEGDRAKCGDVCHKLKED